jgi:hypothetical protein
MDHAQSRLARGGNGMLQFLARAIFGGAAALLVKFAKVEQVIGVIANRMAPGRTLVAAAARCR